MTENMVMDEIKESILLRHEAQKEVASVMRRYAQNLRNEIYMLYEIMDEIKDSKIPYLRQLDIIDGLRKEIKKCEIDSEYYQCHAEIISDEEFSD